MVYTVRFVADEKMPNGRDWLMCRQGDDTTCFIRRSTYDWPPEKFAELLEDTWVGADVMLVESGDCEDLTSH